jgi:phosphonate transport system substrate-binding protein
MRVLVHPLHNPLKLFEVYEPWVDALQQALADAAPAWRLEASASYAAYEAKLAADAFELAWPNPLQTLALADRGHPVLAIAGEDEDFCGLLLVPRDSPVATLADLRGREVAYPAPSSLAATMLPQWMLLAAGVHPLRQARARYVGSQESALLNAAKGLSDAAATWPVPWRSFQREQPAAAARLRVLARSEPLVNNGIVAHAGLPAALRERLRRLLATWHHGAQGRAQLERMGVTRFRAVDAAHYEPVRRFVRAFEAGLRPVDHGG